MTAGGLITLAAEAAHRRAMEIADAAWAPYAKARGLNHRPGHLDERGTEEPRVDGTFEGLSIAFKLATIADMPGVTAVAVPHAAFPLSLHISREGVIAKISKIFGAKDLVLGDAPFDKAYLVGSDNDDAARALLTPATRAEMLALHVATLAYDHGAKASVVLGFARPIAEPEELDRMLRLLVALATAHPAP